MSRRTIQSPGIEIREIDLTQRPAAPIGTSVFIPGFSNQGPTDEVLNVGTFSDFEEIYGKPTNSAERYFYHSVKQVFNSDANVYVSRLPYGAGEGLSDASNKYTALVYPVVAPKTTNITAIDQGKISLSSTISATGSGTVYTEIITKDVTTGQTKYSTFTVNTGYFGPSAVSGANVTSAISSISGDDLVKGTVYSNV